jgi:hypothetical protein
VALEYLLLLCAILYELYTGRVLREGWIFVLWFGIHHPDVVKEGPLKAALETMKQRAPTIATAKSTYLEILDRPDLFPLPNTD